MRKLASQGKARFLWAVLLSAVLVVLSSCGLGGRTAKRARMATAVPSATIAPLIASIDGDATPLPKIGESTIPTSVLACPERTGTLRPESVASTILGSDLGFFVYLPPCYDAQPQTTFPVVYLFHGLGRTPDQWIALGLTETADQMIVTGEIPPLLIVLPYVAGEDSSDAAFLADLLPSVNDRFRTRADRPFRSIGGISRGAEWALRLAMRRADLFGMVGLHSIAFSDGALAQIQVWAAAVPETMRPSVFADVGYADPMRSQTEDLLRMFDSLQWPRESRFQPGDHSDDYWRGNLREYLRGYGSHWK